jgi:hypothetical protein
MSWVALVVTTFRPATAGFFYCGACYKAELKLKEVTSTKAGISHLKDRLRSTEGPRGG